MLSNDYEKLMNYALRILSKKRYTEHEIRTKSEKIVKKNDLDESVIDKVCSRLIELKYLDDDVYARDYVSDRIRFRPRGKFLLRKELRAKGISKDIVDKVLDSEIVNEFEMAMSCFAKKSKKWEKCTPAVRKNKAFQFLGSKGFNGDVVYKVVEHCYNREE